jgi:hypothetical protein
MRVRANTIGVHAWGHQRQPFASIEYAMSDPATRNAAIGCKIQSNADVNCKVAPAVEKPTALVSFAF